MFTFTPKRLRTRQGLLNAAAIVLGCAIALGLGEIGVRVWSRYLAPPEAAAIIADSAPADERGRFVRHPYLNYALRPNYVAANGDDRHNAQGIRDGDPIPMPKPAGEFRIVAIGGSTTYGVGVGNWRNAYPAQLEQVLRETHQLTNVRVINLGVPGYNSWESLVNLAFRGGDLEPDLVVNYDGVNDVHARLVRPDRYVGDDTGHRRQWDTSALDVGWLDSPSYLVRFVAMRLGRLKPPRIEEVVWQLDMPRRPVSGERDPRLAMTPMEALRANPPKYFRRNLLDMVAIQRAHGGETVLLTFASQPGLAEDHEKYAGSPHYQAAIAEQNEMVRKLAKELRVPLVDMATQMPADREFWHRDGVHLTASGNRRFAEIVAAAIHARVAAMMAQANGKRAGRAR